ncbi:MAG: carbohydrate ABC transporter permease, partial [Albidovulum sp.]|nr:carbohydrate ABC transporter permease [Albidovulum sp.]
MKRTLAQSIRLYLGVGVVCAILIFPIYWLFITALSTTLELKALPPTFWPDPPQWQTFAKVAEERPILLWLANSTIAAVGSVVLSMFVSVLAGYSLSRFHVRGGNSMGLF